MVVAAAGSGKSVLLAQWRVRAPEARTVLVRLVPSDSDPVVCGRHLAEALRHAADDVSAPSLPVDGGRLGPTFVDAFLAGLETVGTDVLLVLDDLHTIENPGLVDDLGAIVTQLPLNVRALIGSRWDPTFSLRSARLEGRLVEVRRSELAFDADEGRALVAAVSGHEITEAESAALVSRTDGWAVGLQLAAVSLQGGPASRPVLDAADDRLVAEYLAEEVLDQQEPALRRFLLRTSVLEWLSPEVCDLLTGTGDAEEMLDAAVHRSLFLIPLDGRGDRYRYHHLFADLLRLRLQREDPEAPAELHRRAATWFLAHGHVSEAVDHLLSAGDTGRVFEVISHQGHRLFERGEIATLVRWMSDVVDADPDGPPAVSLNLLAVQVGSDASTDAAETYRRLTARTDLRTEERAIADAFYAVLAQCDLSPAEAQRASAAVLQVLPRLDPGSMPEVLGFDGLATVEGMACFGAAHADLQLGRMGGAVDGFGRLVRLAATRYPIWKIVALGWQSAALAWSGRLTEAERSAVAAVEAAREFGAEDHVSVAVAHLALAAIALDRGDLDTAVVAQRDAEACIRGSRRAVLHALLRLVQARVVAAGEGPWAGIDLLRRPTHLPLGSGLFVTATDAFEASLLVSVDRAREAEAVLVRVGDDPAGRPARVALHLARGDLGDARRVVEGWTPDPVDLRDVVQHGIRTAALLEAEGHHARAVDALTAALAWAEPEAFRQPFRSLPVVLQMLRTLPQRGPRSFASSILELGIAAEASRAVADSLVEPLTEREQSVLAHLPTRSSNTEIAADLYISINTMKTHVRNIYRKLGVTDRDAAVARATELGLL